MNEHKTHDDYLVNIIIVAIRRTGIPHCKGRSTCVKKDKEVVITSMHSIGLVIL